MGLQALIDADILRYEIGYAAEYGWQSTDEEGNKLLPPFDYVAELLDKKIEFICAEAYADEKPVLFLTGATNFRNDIATVKPYKGNRKKAKRPWHYANITAYMKYKYDWVEAEGMEADDLLSIEQVERLHLKDTIICSRDKDLRITPGLHYTWENGQQPASGPDMVTDLGQIKARWVKNKLGVDVIDKVMGDGKKFFYSQCVMGDSTDNIPGIPYKGPMAAWEAVNECTTEKEMFQNVFTLYTDKYGEEAEERFLEQARLLWMVRNLDGKGKPIMYEIEEHWYE